MEDPLSESIPVPMPVDWSRIHQLLVSVARARRTECVQEPPGPLILAGASFSKPSDIRERWVELLKWANANGYADLVRHNLPPPPTMDVATKLAGVTEDGRKWWPTLGDQFEEAKPKPSRDQIRSLLKKLTENWEKIAGKDLAAYTRPIEFKGNKRRRLVVAADPDIAPPWGSWSYIRRDPSSFTALRSSINDLLTPFGVDHIFFDVDKWTTRR